MKETQIVLPTQASLDAMLARVTRVRVVPFHYGKGKPKALLDTSAQDDVAALRATLRIVEDPETFGHCMCLGDPWLELYAGRKLAATLSCHHGRSIRWSGWTWDAVLADGMQLVNWLAERGATGLKDEVERMQQEAERAQRQLQRWWDATPDCLRPFWDQMMSGSFGMATFVPQGSATGGAGDGQLAVPENLRPGLEALEGAFPDPQERVLAVLEWYGQGAGPWSGFPAYESYAENLLLAHPTEVIVAALESLKLTPAQLEGAARYLAGWQFSQQRPGDRAMLPETLKARLLNHVLPSGDEDQIQRAKAAFGGT